MSGSGTLSNADDFTIIPHASNGFALLYSYFNSGNVLIMKYYNDLQVEVCNNSILNAEKPAGFLHNNLFYILFTTSSRIYGAIYSDTCALEQNFIQLDNVIKLS